MCSVENDGFESALHAANVVRTVEIDDGLVKRRSGERTAEIGDGVSELGVELNDGEKLISQLPRAIERESNAVCGRCVGLRLIITHRSIEDQALNTQTRTERERLGQVERVLNIANVFVKSCACSCSLRRGSHHRNCRLALLQVAEVKALADAKPLQVRVPVNGSGRDQNLTNG